MGSAVHGPASPVPERRPEPRTSPTYRAGEQCGAAPSLDHGDAEFEIGGVQRSFKLSEGKCGSDLFRHSGKET